MAQLNCLWPGQDLQQWSPWDSFLASPPENIKGETKPNTPLHSPSLSLYTTTLPPQWRKTDWPQRSTTTLVSPLYQNANGFLASSWTSWVGRCSVTWLVWGATQFSDTGGQTFSTILRCCSANNRVRMTSQSHHHKGPANHKNSSLCASPDLWISFFQSRTKYSILLWFRLFSAFRLVGISDFVWIGGSFSTFYPRVFEPTCMKGQQRSGDENQSVPFSTKPILFFSFFFFFFIIYNNTFARLPTTSSISRLPFRSSLPFFTSSIPRSPSKRSHAFPPLTQLASTANNNQKGLLLPPPYIFNLDQTISSAPPQACTYW